MTTRLVKHQKLTKRQIKEDPLVTAAFRGTQVWEQHGSRILLGVGAVVLVVLLVFFVSRTRAQSEERAEGDLFRAEISVAQTDYATATQMLKEIVDSAPGTKAAAKAMVYLGDVTAAQGKAAEAVSWYRRALAKAGRDEDLKVAGLHGLAAALEDRGDFTQAAASYADLAKLGENDNQRGRAMLAEARSLAKAGQTQKAIAVYKEVQRLPVVDQTLINTAGVGIGELSASSPGPGETQHPASSPTP
ncbi:MAG: tetratricopeptide repeat protein [Candidatus Eisenbacteria bacterium]|uniref:Tetratricopeptide repeat protein n=1 Tax=Eiseniibacteriota bacterium TaxID=2212470 RepID=A0A538SUF1_UNCEI|nr:MAG: tetratricopeptide repeat protein [Candidatus Eisenbacteria bacterium]